MSSLQRRFEILLPRQFNDGQAVPEELFAETLLELRQAFGAVSSETQSIRGIWEHAGQAYRDELIRVLSMSLILPRTSSTFMTSKTG